MQTTAKNSSVQDTKNDGAKAPLLQDSQNNTEQPENCKDWTLLGCRVLGVVSGISFAVWTTASGDFSYLIDGVSWIIGVGIACACAYPKQCAECVDQSGAAEAMGASLVP